MTRVLFSVGVIPSGQRSLVILSDYLIHVPCCPSVPAGSGAKSVAPPVRIENH